MYDVFKSQQMNTISMPMREISKEVSWEELWRLGESDSLLHLCSKVFSFFGIRRNWLVEMIQFIFKKNHAGKN